MTLNSVLFLVCVIVILIYFILKRKSRFWQDRQVPCSEPSILFGHITGLVLKTRSFFDIMIDLYQEFPHKRYNGFYQLQSPMLLIRDLELIKKICIKDFEHFTDHFTFGHKDNDVILGKSLFNLLGQEWKEMRSTLSPAYTSSKMRGMFVFMCECAENFTNSLVEKKKDVIDADFRSLIVKFTNDVIASTAFGVPCNSYKDPDNVFLKMGLLAQKSFLGFNMTLSQLSPALYKGGWRKLGIAILNVSPDPVQCEEGHLSAHITDSWSKRALQELATALHKILGLTLFPKEVPEFFTRLISDNIKQRKEKNIVRPDMIHLLMEAEQGRLKHEAFQNKEEEDGFAVAQESQIGKNDAIQTKHLTLDMMVGQVLIFFFGGFDTVSLLAGFMAYELAVNPDVQKKLKEEIDEAEMTGKLTYEKLMKMKYLDQVVSETLRKWPPGFRLDRICVKDYYVPQAEGEDNFLVIKKGQMVQIPVSGIHMDPKYYPNPSKFDPDRFGDENKSKIVSGSYMPFGVGPRNCIASRFALMEVKILFYYLLSRFEIVPVQQTQIPLKISTKQFVAAPEKGFWLGLKQY